MTYLVRRRVTAACLWIGIGAAFLFDRADWSVHAFVVVTLATVVAVIVTFLPSNNAEEEDVPADGIVAATTGDYELDVIPVDVVAPLQYRWTSNRSREGTFLYTFKVEQLQEPTFLDHCIDIIERLGAGPEAGKHEFILTVDGRFIIRQKAILSAPPRMHRRREIEDEEASSILH